VGAISGIIGRARRYLTEAPSICRDAALPPPPPHTAASPNAPKAIGPYSQATWAGDLLYCSGQTPIDPAVGQLIDGDVEAQTHRCFDNLQAVVEAAGLTMDDVIKCNVYLTDMANFQAMNRAYGTRFSEPYPSRTTVAVAGLPLNAAVEIELIAKRS
jgi:2-iminobutanoate/2-iminopropanoate deaminase